MTRVILVALLVSASACPSKQGTTNTGSGGGGTGAPVAPGCEGARPKVEQLYRAEATATHEKPERIAELVADNTTMVMNDCAKAPDQVNACIKSVTTVRDLETRCLVQLDEEGSEGEELRK